MKRLMEGKVVLVTGAAMGIGAAIARAAAAEGAALVLGDIATGALEETVVGLRQSGARVAWDFCDVTRQSEVDGLVALAVRHFGAPDIVYANAGVEGPLGSPADCAEDAFLRVIDINLNGIFRTIKATLPAMIERGSGSIVATASVAGLVGAAGLPAYVASKHGVVGLVRSTAITVAKTGVRVNALCPGMVETALLERLIETDPSIRQGLLALKPMGRLGTTDEIAAAAIWLGSDQSSFVTGHALAVDGGYAAQ
ncbi:NAD(P)-dependent dehydrogenase, short-chain alcohol dehydrogenase family [Solimonas aquatica]|uniref:NAD(P)-dependent dehydrogenase, short-chain alcohol dehydrogenase family n=1 Tax=Solimonas aquatica TaxID=489703 RepID=A0A1H9LIS2_9GAMM|nr:glucose 1-dehydrogenase [Solimonas aquatica]SER11304.1 NAD(P)-dependent dehydrogenase, short-chain alcohol dehydrogenase family [Solimonas aquatica]